MAQTWSPIPVTDPVPAPRRSVQCQTTVATDPFSAGPNDGMSLIDVGGFDVFVDTGSGQTVTTAFNLQAFVQDPYSGLWCRAPTFDITGNAITGVRAVLLGSFAVQSPIGRIGYQNNGGVASSWANVFLRLIANRTKIQGGLI